MRRWLLQQTPIVIGLLFLPVASLFAEARAIYVAQTTFDGEVPPGDLERINAMLASEARSLGYRVFTSSELQSRSDLSDVNLGDCGPGCLERILRQLPGELAITSWVEQREEQLRLRLHVFELSGDGLRPAASQPAELNLDNPNSGESATRIASALRSQLGASEPEATEGGVRLISLEGGGSALRLITDPADAEIAIQSGSDGRGARVYHITVRRAGYHSARLTVRPESTGQHTLKVHLRRIGAADPDVRRPATVHDELLEEERTSGVFYDALWRSAILPGWGQIHKNSEVRGGIFMSLFAIGVGSYLYGTTELDHAYRSRAHSERLFAIYNLDFYARLQGQNSAYDLFIAYYTASLYATFSDNYPNDFTTTSCTSAENPFCKREERARKLQKAGLGLAGLIYVWSVLDALFADGYVGREYVEHAGQQSRGSIQYNLSSQPDPIGPGVAYEASATWRF